MNASILGIRIKTWAICLFFLFATLSYAHPPFDKAILPSTNISSTLNPTSPSTSSTASPISLLQPPLNLSHRDSKQAAANASSPSNDKHDESQKSYEGDGISSGQPPPGVDIKSADNSAAKKLIPVYVVGGILVLLAGIAVVWALGRKHRRN